METVVCLVDKYERPKQSTHFYTKYFRCVHLVVIKLINLCGVTHLGQCAVYPWIRATARGIVALIVRWDRSARGAASCTWRGSCGRRPPLHDVMRVASGAVVSSEY